MRPAWIALLLSFGTLFLFQLFVYRRLPVAPGEPYGLGDILELLLQVFAYLSAFTIAVFAMIQGSRKKVRAKSALAIMAAATVLMAFTHFFDLRYLRPRF